jgi:hypothetical protein
MYAITSDSEIGSSSSESIWCMKMQGTAAAGSGGSEFDGVGVRAVETRPESAKSMNMEGERDGRSQGATGSESMGHLTWIRDLEVEECERNG